MPFLRRQIGSRLRLKRVPELQFLYDQAIADWSIEPYVNVAIEVNGQPDSIHPLTTAVTGDQIEVTVTVASTRAAPDLLSFVGYSITGQTLRASFTLRKE